MSFEHGPSHDPQAPDNNREQEILRYLEEFDALVKKIRQLLEHPIPVDQIDDEIANHDSGPAHELEFQLGNLGWLVARITQESSQYSTPKITQEITNRRTIPDYQTVVATTGIYAATSQSHFGQTAITTLESLCNFDPQVATNWRERLTEYREKHEHSLTRTIATKKEEEEAPTSPAPEQFSEKSQEVNENTLDLLRNLRSIAQRLPYPIEASFFTPGTDAYRNTANDLRRIASYLEDLSQIDIAAVMNAIGPGAHHDSQGVLGITRIREIAGLDQTSLGDRARQILNSLESLGITIPAAPTPTQAEPQEATASPETEQRERNTQEVLNNFYYILQSADNQQGDITKIEQTYFDNFDGLQGPVIALVHIFTNGDPVDVDIILANQRLHPTLEHLVSIANHTRDSQIWNEVTAAIVSLCKLSPSLGEYERRVNTYNQDERDKTRHQPPHPAPEDEHNITTKDRIHLFHLALAQIDSENNAAIEQRRESSKMAARLLYPVAAVTTALLIAGGEAISNQQFPGLHALGQGALAAFLNRRRSKAEILESLNGRNVPYVIKDRESTHRIENHIKELKDSTGEKADYERSLYLTLETLQRLREEGYLADLTSEDSGELAAIEAELQTILALSRLQYEYIEPSQEARAHQLKSVLDAVKGTHIPGTYEFQEKQVGKQKIFAPLKHRAVRALATGTVSGVASTLLISRLPLLQQWPVSAISSAAAGMAVGKTFARIHNPAEQLQNFLGRFFQRNEDKEGRKARFNNPSLHNIHRFEAQAQGETAPGHQPDSRIKTYERSIPNGYNSPEHRIFRGLMLIKHREINRNSLVNYAPHQKLVHLIQSYTSENFTEEPDITAELDNEAAFINRIEELFASATAANKNLKRDLNYTPEQFIQVILIGALAQGAESGLLTELSENERAEIPKLTYLPKNVTDKYAPLFHKSTSLEDANKLLDELNTSKTLVDIYRATQEATRTPPHWKERFRWRPQPQTPPQQEQEEVDYGFAIPEDEPVREETQEKKEKEEKEEKEKKAPEGKIGSAILEFDRFKIANSELTYTDEEGNELEVYPHISADDMTDAERQTTRWRALRVLISKGNRQGFEAWTRRHKLDIYAVKDPEDPDEINYEFRINIKREK